MKIEIDQQRLIKIMSNYCDDAPRSMDEIIIYIKEVALTTAIDHGKNILNNVK